MLKLLEKVLNVRSYAIDVNELCLFNNSDSISRLDTKEIIFKNQVNLQEIYFIEKFYINDINGNGVYFNEYLDPYFCDYFILFFKDDCVLYSKRDGEERNTFIKKIASNDYLKIKQASTVFIVYNDFLIRKNFESNTVETFSFSTAASLWQYDLSILGEYTPVRSTDRKTYEVVKFIGVSHDQLKLACSNGLILCLNIRTGEEIRRFHQCPEYKLGSSIYQHFNDANSFVLDEKNDILFSLNTYYYMEIKLDSEEVIITDLQDNMKTNDIALLRQSRNYSYDNTHIYTIGEVAHHSSPLTIGDRCLLAFNRTTKEIDWQYVFENDSINTEIPHLFGDKLYQLTSKKILYIFQKENR